MIVRRNFLCFRRKCDDLLERNGGNQRPRRTEVGIKIYVPDYKKNLTLDINH